MSFRTCARNSAKRCFMKALDLESSPLTLKSSSTTPTTAFWWVIAPQLILLSTLYDGFTAWNLSVAWIFRSTKKRCRCVVWLARRRISISWIKRWWRTFMFFAAQYFCFTCYKTIRQMRMMFFVMLCRKADVMNLLESAGFSRSNPYYIVKQGKVCLQFLAFLKSWFSVT